MKYLNIFLIIQLLTLLLPKSLYSQQLLIKGEAECIIYDNKLIKNYEFDVMQSAINNALYNEFGSSVTSNYERLSDVQMEGRTVLKQAEIRSQYINTFPNGIWIKHKTDPAYSTYKDEKNNWWLRCNVSGYAEKAISQPIEFEAKTLDGTDITKDETISYISGESGYLYFRSAIDGYLNIYFDDFKTVQRCLPYNKMDEDLLQVKANHDYLFFSTEKAEYLENSKLVDEIEFFTDDQLEYNQFYILFSTEKISLPILENETETKMNYSTFKSMDRQKFQVWLQNSRLKYKDLQVEIIGITIKNSKYY